jgi:hypothetical protein
MIDPERIESIDPNLISPLTFQGIAPIINDKKNEMGSKNHHRYKKQSSLELISSNNYQIKNNNVGHHCSSGNIYINSSNSIEDGDDNKYYDDDDDDDEEIDVVNVVTNQSLFKNSFQSQFEHQQKQKSQQQQQQQQQKQPKYTKKSPITPIITTTNNKGSTTKRPTSISTHLNNNNHSLSFTNQQQTILNNNNLILLNNQNQKVVKNESNNLPTIITKTVSASKGSTSFLSNPIKTNNGNNSQPTLHLISSSKDSLTLKASSSSNLQQPQPQPQQNFIKTTKLNNNSSTHSFSSKTALLNKLNNNFDPLKPNNYQSLTISSIKTDHTNNNNSTTTTTTKLLKTIPTGSTSNLKQPQSGSSIRILTTLPSTIKNKNTIWPMQTNTNMNTNMKDPQQQQQITPHSIRPLNSNIKTEAVFSPKFLLLNSSTSSSPLLSSQSQSPSPSSSPSPAQSTLSSSSLSTLKLQKNLINNHQGLTLNAVNNMNHSHLESSLTTQSNMLMYQATGNLQNYHFYICFF